MRFKTLSHFLLIGVLFTLTFSCNTEKKDNGNLSDLTPEKVEDLAVLCKVWGFLKYYHPVVRARKYDWDSILIKTIPAIEQAGDASQRNKILLRLVQSLGLFETENAKDTITHVHYKLLPDLSWIKKEILGEALSNQLYLIRQGKRIDSSYYVCLVPDVNNAVFKNENDYARNKYPPTQYRLLSLFRLWNAIHYFFPYKYLMDENWEELLKIYIPKFISAKNEVEYKKCVLCLMTKIQDSHGYVHEFGSNALAKWKGLKSIPVFVSFIENKAVITGIYDSIFCKQHDIRYGDIVEKVGMKDVFTIVKEKRPYVCASNSTVQLMIIANQIFSTNDSVLQINLSREGKTKIISIPTFNKEIILANKKISNPSNDIRLISPEVGYLSLASLKTKDIPEIIKRFSNTKGIIFDIRCYPSDFFVFNLTEHLLPDSTVFAKFSYPSVVHPGYFSLIQPKEYIIGRKNLDYYKGKVIILINEKTQSLAEFTAMALRTAPKSIVVGSTTSGADGDVTSLPLPGGLLIYFSGIGVYYPDGQETQRVGIIPDIYITPTIKGIRDGRDELLEKAIKLIQN